MEIGMKKRVADIVVETLIELGVTNTFCVVGGGAMHLNNAYKIHPEMDVTYCHHEQACAFAAEGYAKYSGKCACVLVTAGPGGVNTLNGVYSAWVDNAPMIVITGFPRYATSIPATGLNLRCRGVQEFDLVSTVTKMTKYAKLLMKAEDVKAEVKKAYDIAMSGRRGPVLISIPLDVQASLVEEVELTPYEMGQYHLENDNLANEIGLLIQTLKDAKRPCILTGSAINNCGYRYLFEEFLQRVKIPVVGGALLGDSLEDNHPLYYGGSGSVGPRVGNYILQNSDFILVIGNSLSTKQTGFNVPAFAPNAKIAMVDIEADEMKKPDLHIELPIVAELKAFFDSFMSICFDGIEAESHWVQYCEEMKAFLKDYDDMNPENEGRVPQKAFWKMFRDMVPADTDVALGNSSGIVGGLTYSVKNKQRVIVNYNSGSMGDDLPEATGIAKASGKNVVCVTGDGSIMMNLQELQTITYNKLPIKVVIFSNDGYGAIRQTCKNFFDGVYTGCDEESGIAFPKFEKIAEAFDYSYLHCQNYGELHDKLEEFFASKDRVILEVEQMINDPVLPKVMSKMNPDGTFDTPTLTDLSPFLTEEEEKRLIDITNKYIN